MDYLSQIIGGIISLQAMVDSRSNGTIKVGISKVVISRFLLIKIMMITTMTITKTITTDMLMNKANVMDLCKISSRL